MFAHTGLSSKACAPRGLLDNPNAAGHVMFLDHVALKAGEPEESAKAPDPPDLPGDAGSEPPHARVLGIVYPEGRDAAVTEARLLSVARRVAALRSATRATPQASLPHEPSLPPATAPDPEPGLFTKPSFVDE